MTTVKEPQQTKSAPKPAPKSAPASSAAASVIGVAAILAIIAGAIYLLKTNHITTPWQQSYDPTGHWIFSTALAVLPVAALLGSIAILRIKAHYAALLGLLTALIVSLACFHMPARLAFRPRSTAPDTDFSLSAGLLCRSSSCTSSRFSPGALRPCRKA